jgi:hypothetical protein
MCQYKILNNRNGFPHGLYKDACYQAGWAGFCCGNKQLHVPVALRGEVCSLLLRDACHMVVGTLFYVFFTLGPGLMAQPPPRGDADYDPWERETQGATSSSITSSYISLGDANHISKPPLYRARNWMRGKLVQSPNILQACVDKYHYLSLLNF